MKEKLGDKQRLQHIIEAISEIESYTQNVKLEEFLANSMMRFASVKQVEIIGEAASIITKETKNRFSDVEWSKIVGMRNVLVHEYFGIDAELVWQVIIEDIPILKSKIQQVINQL